MLVSTLMQIFGSCSFSSVCFILVGARNVDTQLQMTGHQKIFKKSVAKRNPLYLSWSYSQVNNEGKYHYYTSPQSLPYCCAIGLFFAQPSITQFSIWSLHSSFKCRSLWSSPS